MSVAPSNNLQYPPSCSHLSSDSESDPLQDIRYDDHLITDEDHQQLDKAAKDLLQPLLYYHNHYHFMKEGQPLDSKFRAAVLSAICKTAKSHSLLVLEPEQAEELIKKYPQLDEIVDHVWMEGGGFRKI